MLYSCIVLLLAISGLVGIALPVAGQEATTRYTVEDFLQTPTFGAVAVSPDGERVAWTRLERDLEADSRNTELWIAEADGKNARRLTWGNESVGGLAWRPDGALSFLRKVEDASQVWINPLDGSEPRPVTDFEHGVQGYWWSPDGSWLAVVGAAGDEDEEDTPDASEDEEAGDEEEAEGDWIVYDRLEHPEDYPQLWLVPAGNATKPDDERAARRLSAPPQNVHEVDWSPDGSQLAVTYHPLFSGLVDEELRVAVVDVESGSWTDLGDPARHSSLAAFSPDGRRVAFFTDREPEYRAYLNLKDLVIADLATGTIEVLTSSTDATLGGFASTPTRSPQWSGDGQWLYLDVVQGTRQDLYRTNVRTHELRPDVQPEGTVASWSLRGGTLAYVETALHRPGTLRTRPVGRDRSVVVATLNDTVERFDLAAPELLQLPGKDGQVVEGFLFLPPGATRNDRLPAVIEMHGGPYSRYGNAWSTRYPWLVLAQEGFAVFIANPRGGTGHGVEHLRGVYRNFGTDDYEDLMAAVDALVEQGVVDPDRLGFTGYSYGGLMTDVVISRTDRFRCAVSIAGIWNYTSAMGQNNPQLFIDSYRQPWAGDLDLLWEHSPASRAANITTPTLIMHGLADEPVDPRQSIEMFAYLQLNGVPSRLVLYPDEGHGINQPGHMLDYETREIEWFRHYLLGDEDAEGPLEPVVVEPKESDTTQR